MFVNCVLFVYIVFLFDEFLLLGILFDLLFFDELLLLVELLELLWK